MSEFPSVMPHGPIESVTDDVFWVQGSVKLGPGLRITRNMAIVRSGSQLTLFHAVRLSPEGEAELVKLGTVKNVVKLANGHGMDDAYYLDRFSATYWALPGGARDQDPEVQQELRDDNLPFDKAKLFAFQNSKEKEGALLVERGDGILITGDSVQNWTDTAGCSPPAKLVTRLMGFLKRPAQIGPPWRKIMTPKGGTLRPDFERLASLDFAHIVSAHGRPLMKTAKQDLRATIEATYS
jgi:hypothetical protein